MARRPRIQYPGAVYHVMARGNRKSAIFEDDVDRQLFLGLLGSAAERYAFRVYGLCLMGNHYHVVSETPRGNLSDAMRFVNGVYAQASNRRHGRTGHLFEARFRSLVIQQELYLKRVVRYVVLNPVRAHLVTEAAAWPWSSYCATAGLRPAPGWLSLEWLDWAFAATTRVEAFERYRSYVNDPTARKSRIDTRTLAIGRRKFRERLAQAVAGVRELDRPLPPGYRAVARPDLSELLAGVDSKDSRLPRAVYAAHATHGYRQSDIARHLGLDPSRVSKMLRRLRAAGGGANSDAASALRS
jgi:REP-associated tyrosine transposase